MLTPSSDGTACVKAETFAAYSNVIYLFRHNLNGDFHEYQYLTR